MVLVRLSVIISLAALTCVCRATSIPKSARFTRSETGEPTLPNTARVTRSVLNALRSRLDKAGGCNANVCFAIDGSSAISAEQFTAQKNFVLDLVSIIAVDQPTELAAVQYTSKRHGLLPLTNDPARFNKVVNAMKQIRGASFTAVGIGLCAWQLRLRPQEANKLILFSDGKTQSGMWAFWRSLIFRRRGGSLSVVAVGDADRRQLLPLAGFREDRLFDVNNFFDVLELQSIIEKLVEEICEVGTKAPANDKVKQSFMTKA